MHAAVRHKMLPANVTARLTSEERERIELLAQEQCLTPSKYVRQVLLASFQMDATQRMILAEVCALRRELETLLQAISDLDADDVAQARSLADGARDTLVEQRLYQQQKHGGIRNA